ncbi:MAG: hypothetical protein ACM3QW_07065 [Ignavibacteriales bacterium]
MTLPKQSNVASEQKIKLFLLVWALVIISILAVYCAFFGFSVFPVFGIIIIGLVGALGITYIKDKPTKKAVAPADIDKLVKETMSRVRNSCDEGIEQEINLRIDPLIKSAEQRFQDGLDIMWKSGQKLRNDLQEGYLEVRRMLHASSSLWLQEDMIPMYRGVEAILDGYEKLLNELDKMKRKYQEEFEAALEKLKNDTRQRLANDKELTFNYIGSLLANQLADEFKSTGRMLDPAPEKLVEQFDAYFGRRVDGQLENTEEYVARILEDMAATVVGGIQSFTLSQINGCGQALNIMERALNEKSSRTEVVRRLGEPMEMIEHLREEANIILYTLAWQDMMVERRWQEIISSLDSLLEALAKGIDESLTNLIKDHMLSVVRAFNQLETNPNLTMACRRLKAAEMLFVMRDETKLADMKVDGAYILFLYAAAVEDLVEHIVAIPAEELLKNTKLLREDAKAGHYNVLWEMVQKELISRKAEFEVYVKELYPQQFLSFCASPSVRSRPVNAAQAAWFLFVYLIGLGVEAAAQKQDVMCQIGLLLTVHSIRNRYIHPTKGNQYIKLDNPERLDDMRSAALTLFQFASRQSIPSSLPA